jgi:hypothetical protein
LLVPTAVPNSEVAALTQSGLTHRYEHAGPDCWWTSNSGVLAVSKTSSLLPLTAVWFFHASRGAAGEWNNLAAVLDWPGV